MRAVRDVTAQTPREDVVASSPPAAPHPPRRRRAVALGALLGTAAAVAVIVVVVPGDGDEAPRRAARSAPAAQSPPAAALPAPATSALDVPSPADVPAASRPTATWAAVRRAVVARTRPSASAPAVARVGATTPESTDNILQVLGRRDGGDTLWIRVRLAVLPNGTTGWIPRSAVGGLQFAHARLVVRLREHTATLVRDGRTVLKVPVGVGRPDSRTPVGSFYVRNRIEAPADPALGPIAFGTSARAGDGFVAIHGTDRPGDVPGSASQGSIAMRNPDIRRLARLMPVGTPVAIR